MNSFRLREIWKIFTATVSYDRKKFRRRRILLIAYLMILGVLCCFWGISSQFLFCVMPLPAAFLWACGLRVGTVLDLILIGVMLALMFILPANSSWYHVSRTEMLSFILSGVLYFLVIYRNMYMQKREKINSKDSTMHLEDAVRVEHDRFQAMTIQTIVSITNAVDAKDSYTRHHSTRVADYSVMLARKLGWDQDKLEQIRQIALLHDIGKIGISDVILKKQGSLTDEEFEAIKQHTVIGGDILKDLTLLPDASVGALFHHERWNGTGYPYGLKEKQIPLVARIISIADSFDAMNSSRVYRKRMSSEKIMRELRGGSGTQFDPELLEAFLPIAQQLLDSEDMQEADGDL